MLAYTYVEKGKFELRGKAPTGDPGRAGCHCACDNGQYLYQRSAYQTWRSAKSGSRHYGGT